MALKAFYGEIKKAIPEWLKDELVKLHSHVRQDLGVVKKELEVLKDVALIDHNSLRGILQPLKVMNNNIFKEMWLDSCITSKIMYCLNFLA